MHSYKNNLLPHCFDFSLLHVYQVHNYNKRNASAFYVPYCRTNIRQFSVNYQGPKFFNTLSSDVCNALSISIFQATLKLFFFSRL